MSITNAGMVESWPVNGMGNRGNRGNRGHREIGVRPRFAFMEFL